MTESPSHAPSDRASTRLSVMAGVEAGGLAGAAFLLLEYLSSLLLGAASPLGPASVTLQRLFRLEPGTMMEEYLLAVLFVHFTLSIVTTLVLGAIVHRVVLYWAVTLGVVYGLLLYGVNFFGFAFFLPGFTAASDFLMVVNYMIYGGIAAWAYKWRQPPHPNRRR